MHVVQKKKCTCFALVIIILFGGTMFKLRSSIPQHEKPLLCFSHANQNQDPCSFFFTRMSEDLFFCPLRKPNTHKNIQCMQSSAVRNGQTYASVKLKTKSSDQDWKEKGHTFSDHSDHMLDREDRWFERGDLC